MRVRVSGSGCAGMAAGLVMVWFCVVMLAIGGWCANIYKLTQMDNIGTTEGIIRVIGVPALPVGAVLGYVPVSKESKEIVITTKEQ